MILAVTILFLSGKMGRVKGAKTPDVALPTIYKGELLLPKVTDGGANNNVSKTNDEARLGVISANLAAIFDKNNKLTGIRVVGEMENHSDKLITGVSPVVQFYATNGTLIGQKVARPSDNFDFKTILAKDKSLYDVTVDNPPQSDKLEIIFNTTASTDSAVYKPLLISNRNIETKTANVSAQADQGNQEITDHNNSTASGQATPAAQPVPTQRVDYYIVSGQINNPLANPMTDITIYAWAKDDQNKVFALGRTDFKNDLLNPGDKIDFKVILLPIRSNQDYSDYEIAAWGREYKLGSN